MNKQTKQKFAKLYLIVFVLATILIFIFNKYFYMGSIKEFIRSFIFMFLGLNIGFYVAVTRKEIYDLKETIQTLKGDQN